MSGIRFHVLGVPHTKTDPEWSACSFTMKVYNFCKMMTKRGHHVIHYGHEESTAPCTEHVTVVDKEIFNATYERNNWYEGNFKISESDIVYTTFSTNAGIEVRKRAEPLDILLLFYGWGHRSVGDQVRDINGLIIVEPGIGYPIAGIVKENYHVFESYSIMNRYLGWREGRSEGHDPKFYDVVIPNYFDVNDFTCDDRERTYFLYLGRITHDKGLYIAVEICCSIGVKLKIAGQGDIKRIKNDYPPDFVEMVGYANPEKRRELLAGAKGLFAPSLYSEPFGGVAVEAMMSGTPVITTDWGAFPETVLHGVTGFRCRNMAQFAYAVKNIDQLDRKKCREWAVANYSLERVSLMYEMYFEYLIGRHNGKDFNHIEELTDLKWLERYYPESV